MKRSMKIAFLNDGAYAYATGANTAVGGAERDQWLLARALVAAGWSATVGVRDHLKAGERRIIDGVEYTGIGQGQVLLAWHKFLSNEAPDWLFWECAYHLWGVLVEIAKLSRVKTIFHAAFDSDVVPREALSFRRRWWPLYAWGLSRTDRIFVQHAGQLARLDPKWRSKASILPKVCSFDQLSGERLAIRPHRLRDKYIAWVAMLRKHKRPDVLVEIARKTPQTRFVVCGGTTTAGTPEGFGERIIDELRILQNVEYRGQVPPEVAMQVIAEASLFLSTSEEEGFPNTFTQAWSVGTPIISLRLDPDNLIERIGLGRVAGSIDTAVADIDLLMRSPDLREAIACRARRFIVENYSAAKVVKLFESALVS